MKAINKYKKDLKNDENLLKASLIQEGDLEPNMYIETTDSEIKRVLKGEKEILAFLKERYKK